MKIAIIGSGISGLSSAYFLKDKHDITLYEKNSYLGGHSCTIDANISGKEVPIDIGFIVFNFKNYPNLTNFFKHLKVPIAKSDMSFGVTVENGDLEYGTSNLLTLFGQPRNLISLRFWIMLRDIFKFNLGAKEYKNDKITLAEMLDELGFSQWFKDYYICAMGASIWSCSHKEILDFPVSSFIRFFENHGLLTLTKQPQWYTVKGGSKEYVKRLSRDFADKAKLSNPVQKIIRQNDKIIVIDSKGVADEYDHVIMASHSDQTLQMIENPTNNEKKILSAIKYHPNKVYLHSDKSFMQKNKRTWASWVYQSESSDGSELNLTYWMNNLQPLKTKKDIFVTLNPTREPKGEIYYQTTFDHPLFDEDAVEAQSFIDQIQGKDKIWYAGAWQGYGFHEDGLKSAIKICKQLDGVIPWSES